MDYFVSRNLDGPAGIIFLLLLASINWQPAVLVRPDVPPASGTFLFSNNNKQNKNENKSKISFIHIQFRTGWPV